AVLWGILAWRHREDPYAMPVVATGLLLGALVYGTAPSEPPLPTPPPPVPDALRASLAGGACQGDPALWTSGEWRIYATCDGTPTVFSIGPNGVRASSSTPGPVQAAAVAHLESRWTHKTAPPVVTDSPDSEAPHLWSRRDLGEVALCAGIAGAAALALLWLQILFAWRIWERSREDKVLLAGLVLAAVLVVVVHTGAPSRMVMTYTGYDLTSRLAFLETPPRYGAGAPWLYAPWFAMVGLDHSAVQVANRWMGALTLLPLTCLTLTVARGARWAPLLVSLLFASLPVVWRDHTSEGIQTGTTLLVLSALAAWSMTVTRGAIKGVLLAALPVAALAVVCRPEVAPALAMGILGLRLLPEDGDEDDALLGRGAWSICLAAGCLALAVAPHGLWLADEVHRLVGEGAIAPVETGLWDRVMHTVLYDNILVRGPWAPGALSVWLLVGLLLRGPNALACLGLGLAAFVWVGITSVDLPVVSIPRVHLPALLLLFPVIAVGFERLQEIRFANPVLITWMAVASLLSIEPALAPGPEDAEEALIQAALTEVSEREGACVARVGFGDPPPPGKTQRHFPAYLFAEQAVVDLSEIEQVWEECDGGMVAVLGTRCYLSAPESEIEDAGQETAHAICTTIRERYRLSPLLELEVSPPDPGVLRGYPRDATMRVGAYVLSHP
ncbi:MAG: hypothetical protein VYE15_07955, partial [Myxococcota bacterium]|nr:hypothetical protein [Myxococcota bacterium]